MSVELHLGDCLEFMRSMPDKSVDAVITDPPYGIKRDKGFILCELCWVFVYKFLVEEVFIVLCVVEFQVVGDVYCLDGDVDFVYFLSG